MVEVYDIETTKSAFTYVGLDIKTNKISQFILHKDLNELSAMVTHIKSLKGMIGFNNINFDYPILHYIFNNYCNNNGEYCYWVEDFTACNIIDDIYNEAQRIINDQNKPFSTPTAIRQKDVLIPQLDLFRVWHFNNKARMTSLKSLEIAMNYPNVMDMPIDFRRDDIGLDEVKSIIMPYNINDVKATHAFYIKSIDKLSLRKGLHSKYGLPCINYPDSKIGEELVLKLYCEATGLDIRETKKLRSERSKIALKDCIFNYIQFKTPEFNKLLEIFNNKVIVETKGAIKESVIYKGFKYDYGTGGIHGCIKAGVYESDDNYLIIDADVKCGVLTH